MLYVKGKDGSGVLEFQTGKKVELNVEEKKEFDLWLKKLEANIRLELESKII